MCFMLCLHIWNHVLKVVIKCCIIVVSMAGRVILTCLRITCSYLKSGVTVGSTGYLYYQGTARQFCTSSHTVFVDDISASILYPGILLYTVLPSFFHGKASSCAAEKGQLWLENCIKKKCFMVWTKLTIKNCKLSEQ